MILLLLAWIYYSALFFLFGSLVKDLIARIIRIGIDISLFYSVWIGMAGVLCILSACSLFYRTNIECHLLLALIALIYLIRNFTTVWNDLKTIYSRLASLHFLIKTAGCFLFIFILFIATDGPVYNLDPGRYHFQNMLWAHTYPVVPGLANLHDRFGNSSAWYLLHAAAEVFPFQNRSYHIFNSLIFAWLMLYCLVAFDSLFKKDFSVRTIFLVVIFFFMTFYFDFIYFWYLTCLSPDLPVNIVAVVCFLFLLDFIDSPGKDFLGCFIIYTILATQAFSVRMSAIYMLLPLFWLFFQLLKSAKNKTGTALSAIGFSFFLLVPVLVRNVVLTGWILFPMATPDLFAVDWKLPESITRGIMHAVSTTGLMEEGIAQTDFEKIGRTANTPHLQLLFGWLMRQILHGGFIYWIIAGSGLFCAVILIKGKTAWEIMKPYSMIFFFSVLAVITWIFSSPNFRFGFAYVGISFCLPVALSVKAISSGAKYRALFKPILWILFLVMFAGIIIRSTTVSVRANGFNYPFVLARYVIVNSHPLGLQGIPATHFTSKNISSSVAVNIPVWDSSYINFGRNKAFVCEYADTTGKNPEGAKGYNSYVGTMLWLTPLPAAGGVYEGLEPRSDNIKDGFRIRGIKK